MKTLFALMILFVVSCNSPSKESTPCPDFVKEKTGRDAVLFFHRPISGSTYQLVLFPVCDQSREQLMDSLVLSGQLSEGVSFVVVSDDKQFQDILRRSSKVDLVTSDSTGWNFKHIYYSFVKVDILSDIQSERNMLRKFKSH